MRIEGIKITNLQSFGTNHNVIPFKKLTVITGEANSGKSTVLKLVHRLLQDTSGVDGIYSNSPRIRHGEGGQFECRLKMHARNHKFSDNKKLNFDLIWNERGFHQTTGNSDAPTINYKPYNNSRDQGIVIYYSAKRSTEEYSEEISPTTTYRHTGTTADVYARVDDIISAKNKEFEEFAKSILGANVVCRAKGKGKQAGVSAGSSNSGLIPFSQMGDGAVNMLCMAADILQATGKVILIDEPENHVHGKVLKAFLSLLRNAAEQNQVIVTTHSPVVLTYLGGKPDSEVTYLDFSYDENSIPTTKAKKVSTAEDRLQVLRKLGYGYEDFSPQTILFFEESSIELVVKELLINEFAPKLNGRAITVAADGFKDIQNRVNAYANFMLYVHLEDDLDCHVIIDKGSKESAEIARLTEKFPKLETENRIHQLQKHDFEDYLPDRFSEDIAKIESEEDKKRKYEMKKKLYNDKVKRFIKDDRKNAKKEFEESAEEIIEILRKIEEEFAG